MGLFKLWIRVFREKDCSESSEVPPGFVALFNPSEYTLSRSNNWQTNPAVTRARPHHTFVGGNPDELSMNLFFDGTGAAGYTGPVTKLVDKFLGLLSYHSDEHRPYYVKVCWGSLVFQGILKSASVNYTLFDPGGNPIRAKVDASFEQVAEDTERAPDGSDSSPDVTHVWVTKEGDSLPLISYEIYRNSSHWREIARVNGLSTGRALPPGLQLALPPLELAGRRGGS